MCPHVETDTRGSSKTLVRHTCKACLKVFLELPPNEVTVPAGTAKDVSRADTSQFRDISRAMHVRPQLTLNARRSGSGAGTSPTCIAHVHLSRFSSISATVFISLFDDAIESILEPTETVTARNTGTTITTNDTSSVTVTGAASSLSASQSGTAIQSKAFVAYCSNNTDISQEQRSNQKPLSRIARTTAATVAGAPKCFRTTSATVAGSTNGCGRGWKRDWPAV